jgi:hypothetical protein
MKYNDREAGDSPPNVETLVPRTARHKRPWIVVNLRLQFRRTDGNYMLDTLCHRQHNLRQ